MIEETWNFKYLESTSIPNGQAVNEIPAIIYATKAAFRYAKLSCVLYIIFYNDIIIKSKEKSTNMQATYIYLKQYFIQLIL